MKLLKNIMLFAVAAAFVSCETDVDTPQVSAPDAFIAPVIEDCSDVIVNADNAKDETVVFAWTPAQFGQPMQIVYTVYVTNGTKSTLVGTTSSTSLAVSKSDLNGAVINGLGVKPNETASVSAYVTAQMTGVVSSEPIASNKTKNFSVTTYLAPLSPLYLCGEFCWSDEKLSGWDEKNASVFWETSGGTKIFNTMVDFTKGQDGDDATRSYFKVLTAQNWDNSYGYDGLEASWTYPEQKDKNFSLPLANANIYTIKVNLAAKTIESEAIGKKLGLAGEFNNWGNDGDPDIEFKYDYTTGIWKTDATDIAAGKIKVRVDGAWTKSWGIDGTPTSSVAVEGGIELNGADNYTLATSGKYIVELHANRTPFVLKFVAQK